MAGVPALAGEGRVNFRGSELCASSATAITAARSRSTLIAEAACPDPRDEGAADDERSKREGGEVTNEIHQVFLGGRNEVTSTLVLR